MPQALRDIHDSGKMCVQGGGKTRGESLMGEQFFDDLARGLDDGTISRRRALKLAGGALVGAVVPFSVFPREAEARRRCNARCRCRRKGGTRVPADPTSPCRCADMCPNGRSIFCNSSKTCYCRKTIDGEGYCAGNSGGPPCASNAECTALLGANARCTSCPGLLPGVDAFCSTPCTTP